MKSSRLFLDAVWHCLRCVFCIVHAHALTSADCWFGEWRPEVCCGSPGAKGNPLCWDQSLPFDQCCTQTQEGVQFDLQRRNFVADGVRRGATVHFDIRSVSRGRTGAVASKTLSSQATVLRVPSTQVFSLKSLPVHVAAAGVQEACDPHAQLALGLAYEKVNPKSKLADWMKLLPSTFANLLWFTPQQLDLVNSTFFAYIVQNWYDDLNCMQRAAERLSDRTSERVSSQDFRWALSIVKTRGFALEGTHDSTMLIPLADFWNHDIVANIRTAALAEDELRFVATRDIMLGEELCIDYGQASNLEFLIRYGFRMEENPYGGRQFDLGGDPLQAHCPSFILRYDLVEVIENETIDCHRQARYVSFEHQFGQIQPHEQLREDRYIYRAIEEACNQLVQMLQIPRRLSTYDRNGKDDAVTSILLEEIRTERVLLQRCVYEFQNRQHEPEPRHVPNTLAPSLANFHADSLEGPQNIIDVGFGKTESAMPSGLGYAPISDRDSFGGHQLEPSSFAQGHVSSIGAVAIDAQGNVKAAETTSGELSSTFSETIDRSRVDQLLHRLQHGLSLQ